MTNSQIPAWKANSEFPTQKYKISQDILPYQIAKNLSGTTVVLSKDLESQLVEVLSDQNWNKI